MARRGPTTNWAALLPLISFLLIGMCWVLSTPPSGGVDEGSHFVRMIGISQGGLIGGEAGPLAEQPGLDAAQLERVRSEAGMFEVPASMVVPVACNNVDTTLPYDCPPIAASTSEHLEISFHGHTLPLSYAVPAILSLAASTTWRAFLFGRMGYLIQNAALLAVALLALRRSCPRFSSTALGTLALCVTPLLTFQSGTLAPNGTEVWATVSFLCALVAALRTTSTRWLWIAAAVGSIACWTRDLGALEVIAFGVAALVAHPDGARWLWRQHRTRNVLAAVLLALAGLGSVIWQLALKTSLQTSFGSPAQTWRDLGATVSLLRDSVGLVGWLNIRIDPVTEGLWIAGWVAGVAVLFTRADRRTRWVVSATALFYVLLNTYLIVSLRSTGFGAQARFTIAVPIAAVVLLVVGQPAGMATVRRLPWPLLAACAVVALGNFSALLLSADHNADGITTAPFDFAHAVWAPPGGWNPMLALFAVACASVVMVPLVAIRRPSAPVPVAPTELAPGTDPA